MIHEYVEDVRHLAGLKYAGFNPKTVIDIGVSNGEFFYGCQQIFTDAEYFLFEARKKNETTIEKTLAAVNVKTHVHFDTLLGDSEKTVKFYQIDAGSSVYEEKTSFPRTVIKKKVKTLRSFINKHTKNDWNKLGETFVKIDTQGSELDILSGCFFHEVRKFSVIQLETALLEYNKNAPTVLEVFNAMDYYGFQLYNVLGGFRRETDGALFHQDFVFVRKDHPLVTTKKPFWNAEASFKNG